MNLEEIQTLYTHWKPFFSEMLADEDMSEDVELAMRKVNSLLAKKANTRGDE